MFELPIEVFQLVLEYLNLVELENCKLVNKLFYYNVKKFRIKELCHHDHIWSVSNDNWFYNNSIWFYVNKPIKRNYFFKTNSPLSLLKSSSFNFDCLKYLTIDCNPDNKINLSDLNKFDKLKVLIVNLSRYENKKSTKLSLNNLIALRIVPSDCVVIRIDTPMLEALDCLSFGQIELNYPEKIKYLKTKLYSSNLVIFNNLEHLDLLFANRLIRLFDLKKFTKLKSLQILNGKLSNEVIKFFERNEIVGRADLNVYSKGVLLPKRNEISCNLNFNLAKDLRNFEISFPVLDWIYHVFYNSLMSSINQQLPVGFFQKYCNIIGITVKGKVINQFNLIKFIDNCRVLRELVIIDSKLNQQFFDQLPLISLLEGLEIKEDSKSSLDYNFIFKMNHLSYLITNQRISIDTIAKLDQSKNIKQVFFNINEKLFQIYRSKDSYSAKFHYLGENLIVPNDNLNIKQIIYYLNLIDSLDSRILNSYEFKRLKYIETFNLKAF